MSLELVDGAFLITLAVAVLFALRHGRAARSRSRTAGPGQFGRR